jgi:anti-sigma factor RsiW
VTSEQARELFSAAYDAQLDAPEQEAFDHQLESDAELAREYAAFCATLDAVRADAATPPDLLRGVQTRLRNASGGRYYADRFAERSGVGWLQPWVLLIACAVLMGLAWLAFRVLHVIQVAP